VVSRLPARLAAAVLRQPRPLVRWLARRYPDVLFEVESDERIVALTIDDGPHAPTTERILDVLDRHRARATFFLLCDNVPGNECVVRGLVARGHEIGNHLLRDTPSVSIPTPRFAEQLDQSHAILSAFGAVRWFRPSSGWFNQPMLRVLGERGYRCVLGSVYPYDPIVSSVRVIEEHILSTAHPGAIIVLHDGPDRGRHTADALAHIVPALTERGYRIVTVSELMPN
jgi:peptidoglycan-N-acetylglucosamine deacetylase